MITIAIPQVLFAALLLPSTFVVVCGAVVRAGRLWIDRAPDTQIPR